MLERMPGRLFEDLSEVEGSGSVDVDLHDFLTHAISGRFQRWGGSDPFPTILRHVSGMKTTYTSSIMPP